MTATRDDRPGWTGWLFGLAMFVGLPALVVGVEGGRHAPATLAAAGQDAPAIGAPATCAWPAVSSFWSGATSRKATTSGSGCAIH